MEHQESTSIISKSSIIGLVILSTGSLLLMMVLTLAHSKRSENLAPSGGSRTSVKAPLLTGRFSAELGQSAEILTPEKTAREIAKPAKIVIDAIGLGTEIKEAEAKEDNYSFRAGLEGKSVSWLSNTVRPGKAGVSILAGEYGAHGRGVFSKIQKLRIGQKILIIDEGDIAMYFEITSIEPYQDLDSRIKELLLPEAETAKIKLIVDSVDSKNASSLVISATLIE